MHNIRMYESGVDHTLDLTLLLLCCSHDTESDHWTASCSIQLQQQKMDSFSRRPATVSLAISDLSNLAK